MGNKKSILIVGPFPKPITGLSLANKIVKEILDKNLFFKVSIVNTSFPSFKENIGKFSFQKLVFFLKANLQLYRIFQHQIIYITPGQTFLGVLKYGSFIILGAFLKKEMIVHVHGNYLGTQYNLLSGIKKKVFHFLISQFTKGIVLSDSLKPNLQPFLTSEKIFSLPNFAQPYLISENQNVETSELKIIYLSNLMKEKGIFTLLNALQILEVQKIKYSAKIAGNIDDSSLKQIQSKIKKLKHTSYIGIVDGQEKKELLDWGNIFVLPTYYKMEGQPISILEAMATKNVIITTQHAGIPDLIEENNNGFFIDPKGKGKLEDILIFLAKHQEEILRIAEFNRTHFLRNFTLRQFEENLLQILDK